jgi:subtilisin
MVTIRRSGLLRVGVAAMRQRCMTLFIFIIILGLILSDGLVSSLFSPASGLVRTAWARGDSQENSAPLLKTQPPRKLKRQRDGRHHQNPEHKPNLTKADRSQAPKQNDGKAGHKKKDKKRDGSKAGARRPKSAKDRYIVVLKPNTGDLKRAVDAVTSGSADVTITQVYEHAIDGFAAVIPDDQLDEVRRDPRVQAVVPDEEVQAFEQTLPTGINRIDADQNATAKIDSRDDKVDVDVAVLDTGIGPHPDLNVVGGISCADGEPSYADERGHGTHVAGTIGALDNGVGVVGVAPGARLWSVKVLHRDGRGLTSEIICGLDWVAANSDKIEVANMSLGLTGADSTCPGNDPLHNAVCRVVDAGVTMVVAAGNSRSDAATFRPATFEEVIAVSALADSDGLPDGKGAATMRGPDDSLADFSNFGPDVDLAAPGVDILSTALGGGYAYGYGTSMAAPHAAGAAALFLANHPGSSPAEVKRHLLSAKLGLSQQRILGDPGDLTIPRTNAEPPLKWRIDVHHGVIEGEAERHRKM